MLANIPESDWRSNKSSNWNVNFAKAHRRQGLKSKLWKSSKEIKCGQNSVHQLSGFHWSLLNCIFFKKSSLFKRFWFEINFLENRKNTNFGRESSGLISWQAVANSGYQLIAVALSYSIRRSSSRRLPLFATVYRQSLWLKEDLEIKV